MFFESNETIKIFRSFIFSSDKLTESKFKSLPQTIKLTSAEKEVSYLYFVNIINIIKDFSENAKIWDEFSLNYSIDNSERLLTYLERFSNGIDEANFDELIENIKNIFLLCYPFVKERELLSPTNKESDFNRSPVYYFFLGTHQLAEFLNENELAKLDKLENEVFLNVLKSFLQTENLIFFDNFRDKKEQIAQSVSEVDQKITKTDEKLNEIEEKFKKFDTSLSERENRVKSLNAVLEKHETAFNFVGLYKGFNDLSQKKVKEVKNTFYFLISLAIALVLIPLTGVFSLNIQNNMGQAISEDILTLLPLVSLELILIYFFRVVLHSYKSTKAQILQIELRQTLCQFIQNYADYSKDIKKDNPTVLEKFENLIFSGIISDAESLPSTFDGMDQIVKLFSTLKGKG